MRDAQKTYDRLCEHARSTALLVATEALLGWDERTLLPPDGAEYRAEQITLLAGLIHKRRTDPRIGEWLAQLASSSLAGDPHSDTGATIRQMQREFEKRRKLPQSLVEELTRTASLAQHAWQAARANDDFASFRPLLAETYRLKRLQAAAIGYDENPYDALLDDYEPRAVTAEVAGVLAELRAALVPLVAAIAGGSRRPNLAALNRHYPVAQQEAFGRMAAAAVGFDFRRGRLDTTVHPFCSGMGPHDCRITTRYDDHFFPTAFFGILHEAGHGMYDQGLQPEAYGLPIGEAISLGIHESQSRLWENVVGRSRAFWHYFFPAAQQAFPAALAHERLDDFYFAINDVRPSLVRVEADEATYNLHILIRFELEQELLADNLRIDDLPEAWNAKYVEYLGIQPPNDSQGVLQDIHWAAGLVGYFPTYSLGNLYAAQLFAQAESDIGPLAEQFACGDFRPLGQWLSERIYTVGQRYTAAELIERVSGKPLSHAPLIAYLRRKLEPLYGI